MIRYDLRLWNRETFFISFAPNGIQLTWWLTLTPVVRGLWHGCNTQAWKGVRGQHIFTYN